MLNYSLSNNDNINILFTTLRRYNQQNIDKTAMFITTKLLIIIEKILSINEKNIGNILLPLNNSNEADCGGGLKQ